MCFLHHILFLNCCAAIEIGELVDMRIPRYKCAHCRSQASKAETRNAQTIANDQIETLVQVSVVIFMHLYENTIRLC